MIHGQLPHFAGKLPSAPTTSLINPSLPSRISHLPSYFLSSYLQAEGIRTMVLFAALTFYSCFLGRHRVVTSVFPEH